MRKTEYLFINEPVSAVKKSKFKEKWSVYQQCFGFICMNLHFNINQFL